MINNLFKFNEHVSCAIVAVIRLVSAIVDVILLVSAMSALISASSDWSPPLRPRRHPLGLHNVCTDIILDEDGSNLVALHRRAGYAAGLWGTGVLAIIRTRNCGLQSLLFCRQLAELLPNTFAVTETNLWL